MLVIHWVICQSRASIFFELNSHGLVCTVWPISEVARSRRFGSKPPHWCQNSGPSLRGKGKGATLGSDLVGDFWDVPNFWMSKIHDGEKTCLVARKR